MRSSWTQSGRALVFLAGREWELRRRDPQGKARRRRRQRPSGSSDVPGMPHVASHSQKKERQILRASKGTLCADALVRDFWPQNGEEQSFLLFEPCRLW